MKRDAMCSSLQRSKVQQSAYLRGKGIQPAEQYQLDLIFPHIGARSDLRHIPNDYARSSLFTTRNKREERKPFQQALLYHYNEDIEIRYTGLELRAEDDEIVWLQILNYGQQVPLGDEFAFNIKDLVKDVGWHKNGRNYDRVRECISRLKATEVLALNKKAYGESGAISLIQNYTAINDGDGKSMRYRVWIHPSLILLFAGNMFTSHSWETYRNLSPVARRLADYIKSHAIPNPLAIEKFRRMCGSSNSTARSWRQVVEKACAEVQAAGIAVSATLDVNGQIHCVRK